METRLTVPTRRVERGTIDHASCGAEELAFCHHWLVYRSAGAAYLAAFRPDISRQEAARRGYDVFRRPAVQAEIAALQKVQREHSESVVTVDWLIRRFMAIATADPRELASLKVGCCRRCHGEGFGYQWREHEYVAALGEAESQIAALPPDKARLARLPDIAGGFGYDATRPPNPACPACDGEGQQRIVPIDTDNLSDEALLLFGGLKVKPGGVEVVIADRVKALEMVGRMLGAFTDKVSHEHTVKQLVAIADIGKLDPKEASRQYQEFIQGRIAAT